MKRESEKRARGFELAYRKASASALRDALYDLVQEQGGVFEDDVTWWELRHKLEIELAAIRVIEDELSRVNTRGRVR